MFTSEQLLEKEKEVLVRIGFRVDFPNSYRVLRELKRRWGFREGEFHEEVRLLKVAQEDCGFYRYSSKMLVEVVMMMAEDGPQSASVGDKGRLEEELKVFSAIAT